MTAGTDFHRCEWVILCCLENLRERIRELPVPQTDTGGQVENTKAIERTVVKELGKIPP